MLGIGCLNNLSTRARTMRGEALCFSSDGTFGVAAFAALRDDTGRP
ncbi:hypothetical protein GCM10010524_08470 [Streptomyces mexicanus]|jgi:hypothetical protein